MANNPYDLVRLDLALDDELDELISQNEGDNPKAIAQLVSNNRSQLGFIDVKDYALFATTLSAIVFDFLVSDQDVDPRLACTLSREITIRFSERVLDVYFAGIVSAKDFADAHLQVNTDHRETLGDSSGLLD